MENKDKTIITLSLCGKIYKVEKYILERSLYFKDIFDEYAFLGKELGELYIPRAPIAFDHILNYLIYDGEYEVPKQFNQDMKYFLLEKVDEKKVETIEYKCISDEIHSFDISDESCLKYGFKHGDNVVITDFSRYNGKTAKVIGVRNNNLWVHIEGDKGASYFEGEYLPLIAKLI